MGEKLKNGLGVLSGLCITFGFMFLVVIPD